MYWAQIYILPKNVLQEITKVCRAFLWSDLAYSSKPSNVAWHNTCSSKQTGGLGFRDVMLWNTASMGKYVWALTTKQDNVWVKWVTSVYLKNGEWWGYQPVKQARLQTTAKLAKIGISTSASCLICGQGDEIHDHLFFRCTYSNMCLVEMKKWMGLQCGNKLQYIFRDISHSRRSKFRKQVVFAAVVALVYLIWRCRNTSYWERTVPTVSSTISSMKQVVKSIIQAVLPKNVSRSDSQWFLAL
ncbi:uncharacterized protein [Spinacia oleracea]|uniref:Reverse transcriptase zinc-binding domain-containing protein n=1 Tax=Spinacia oleracea TaxID=3562 RepID=A0ABM3RSD4_SPIOL|nr:uncharacterized protein LOC130472057 [Spinacia oleracea]